ncbi:hypothetical protein BHE74_00030586 [Ensete ventricosum]|nr:hypothetical protein GW17_00050485 [Ensete ventricosum]RWW62277.1 hypothetical protein BHE74_00030586 [Ensete ventricosum]
MWVADCGVSFSLGLRVVSSASWNSRPMRALGLDGNRGGSRPRHGWSGSDPCPSYLVVQLFFLDTREGNHRHKSVRLSCLYFSSDLRL